MIGRILGKGASFRGVSYNTEKINLQKGELMDMQNFPFILDNKINRKAITDYLKAVTKMSKRIKKPQFHAMIGCEGREYNKKQLTEIANMYMDRMGYKNQPYIIVFHGDTDNNHVHIVSTRIDVLSGKKIDDSFENEKNLKVIANIMEEKYGITSLEKLNEILDFSYQNESQLSLLLEQQGFKLKKDPELGTYKIYHFSKKPLKDLKHSELNFHDFDTKKAKKVAAIINTYRTKYNTELNPVYHNETGKIINYESELTHKLHSKLGYQFIFHFKDNKAPFGYTLIDFKNKEVFKGSQIMKLKDFTMQKEGQKQKINVNQHRKHKNYNINNGVAKKLLCQYFNIDPSEINYSKRKLTLQEIEMYKMILHKYDTVDKLKLLKNEIPYIKLISDQSNMIFIDTERKNLIDANLVISQTLKQEYFKNTAFQNMNDNNLIDDRPDVDNNINVSDAFISSFKGIFSTLGAQHEPERKKKKNRSV